MLLGISDFIHRNRALRSYEFSNHLGNVLTTVLDYKYIKNIDGKLKYDAVVKDVYDYYPFGMQKQARGGTLDNRYGFNGKELDNFALATGESHSQYDYGFRIYNPAIAKFLSVDPLRRKYPMLTPYQFASNKPIWAIDLDGLEALETSGGETMPIGEFNERKENNSPAGIPYSKNIFNMRPVELSDVDLIIDKGLLLSLDLTNITISEEILESKTVISTDFSNEEIYKLKIWNSDPETESLYRTQDPSGDPLCMHFALGGVELLLEEEIPGWRTRKGNYNFSEKNVFTIGDNLVTIGSALEVTPSGIGMKGWNVGEQMERRSKGNSNSIFLIGPGAAHHTILGIYNSNSLEFLILDNHSGWDMNGSMEEFNAEIESINSAGNSTWTNMYQLQHSKVISQKTTISRTVSIFK